MHYLLSFIFSFLLAPDPAPQNSQVISKKNKLPFQSSIAVNPLHPNQMIACSGTFLYTSADSGFTWEEKPLKTLPQTTANSLVHCNVNGVFFLVHLSRPPCASGVCMNTIHVMRSDNGGKTWKQSTVNTGNASPQSIHVTSDEAPLGRRLGRIYITWAGLEQADSFKLTNDIYLSYSDDGQQFSKPNKVNELPGRSEKTGLYGSPSTAVGPYGQLYITWSGSENIYFDGSYDGGNTFGRDRIIGVHNGGWYPRISGLSAVSAGPALAYDLSDGPRRGWLYLCYSNMNESTSNVYLLYSKDDGQNWAYRQVNKRIGKDPGDCFSPTLAVNSKNGNIAVAYYRRDTLNFFIEPEIAVVTNPLAGTGDPGVIYARPAPFPSKSSEWNMTALYPPALISEGEHFTLSWVSGNSSAANVLITHAGKKTAEIPAALIGFYANYNFYLWFPQGTVTAAVNISNEKEVMTDSTFYISDTKRVLVIPYTLLSRSGLHKITVKTNLGKAKEKIDIPHLEK